MMRNANIVTLYKNKGARRACNNYQGISLLSIAIKLFARVILKGLQVLAGRFYPESSCGFPAKRSTLPTCDAIYSFNPQSQTLSEDPQATMKCDLHVRYNNKATDSGSTQLLLRSKEFTALKSLTLHFVAVFFSFTSYFRVYNLFLNQVIYRNFLLVQA